MDRGPLTLTVDTPDPGVVRLDLADEAGRSVVVRDIPLTGHVDNLLLTAFDKMVQESILDRSALITVKLGPGIDRNSALCRIVKSFASALGAGRQKDR